MLFVGSKGGFELNLKLFFFIGPNYQFSSVQLLVVSHGHHGDRCCVSCVFLVCFCLEQLISTLHPGRSVEDRFAAPLFALGD